MAKLYHKKLGSGYPLLILHGLYGSGANWYSIAKELSAICEVFLVDLRNHGRSPHTAEHDYASMAQDVLEFLNDEGIEKPIILGHSMGGKVAMWLATQYPQRVNRLIVADISPLSYIREGTKAEHIVGHEQIMDALLGLDMNQITSLKDAEEALQSDFPDRKLRQFLLKNLGKDAAGNYIWNLNLPLLRRNIYQLADGLDLDRIGSKSFRAYPVLFIRGENSPYIGPQDEAAIKKLFPSSNLVSINNAGHWLHAEQPRIFTEIVRKFLLEY